jgi:hypothetical protein
VHHANRSKSKQGFNFCQIPTTHCRK